jgi:hypothetical protein
VSSRVSLNFFTNWQKRNLKDELIRMSTLCAGTLSLWGIYVNGFFLKFRTFVHGSSTKVAGKAFEDDSHFLRFGKPHEYE